MSEKTIDTSGFSCPQPLLMVKKALESESQDFSAIIDTEVARENISRFLDNENVDYEVEKEPERYIFKIKR